MGWSSCPNISPKNCCVVLRKNSEFCLDIFDATENCLTEKRSDTVTERSALGATLGDADLLSTGDGVGAGEGFNEVGGEVGDGEGAAVGS